jgi:UDP-2,3-diacylglucosamine hydrolase
MTPDRGHADHQRRHEAVLVSDIHLDAAAPHTAQAFFDFMARHAAHTRQFYVLGDLFEAWPGDDALNLAFNTQVVACLRAASDAGAVLYWMAGNRDFLIGPAFAAAAGLTLLPDPSVVTIAGRRILLSHGDAACTDDSSYQAFRAQVRSPMWQQAFLARPLAERLHLIAGMREGSRQAQRGKAAEIMDVNPDAIAQMFSDSGTDILIHGHTHRPAVHRIATGKGEHARTRHVLTDWDCEGQRRGGGLAIDADGSISTLGL